jgi:hypothetical protein
MAYSQSRCAAVADARSRCRGGQCVSDREEDFYRKPGQLYFHHRFHVAIAFLVFLVGMLVAAYSGYDDGVDNADRVRNIGLVIMGIGFIWLVIANILRWKMG